MKNEVGIEVTGHREMAVERFNRARDSLQEFIRDLSIDFSNSQNPTEVSACLIISITLLKGGMLK